MPHRNLKYVPASAVDALRNLMEQLFSGKLELTPEQLLEKIKAQLPIEKMNPTTLIQRVEGLYYVTELFWIELVKNRGMNRGEIVHKAGLKPLSYYHHKLGSRMPVDMVVSRDDYFADPPTAHEKLADDILGLARMIGAENTQNTAAKKLST